MMSYTLLRRLVCLTSLTSSTSLECITSFFLASEQALRSSLKDGIITLYELNKTLHLNSWGRWDMFKILTRVKDLRLDYTFFYSSHPTGISLPKMKYLHYFLCAFSLSSVRHKMFKQINNLITIHFYST